MHATSYPSPVDKLLAFGECNRDWPNYLELGFGQEHVPDLIRMATDEALNMADSSSLLVWAPVHAWRTLGQLRTEAAITPLVEFFDRVEPSDYYPVAELPKVLGMIGPAAVPALAKFIADPARKMYPRSYAGDSLAEIGKRFPDSRGESIAGLVAGMQNFEKNEPDLNGFLIGNLLDLKAVEAAPVIDRAFAAGCVDGSIAGDWKHVQRKLGLSEPPEEAFDHRGEMEGDYDQDEEIGESAPFSEQSTISHDNRGKRKAEKAKMKNKRAMAKKSRRQNRRKK